MLYELAAKQLCVEEAKAKFCARALFLSYREESARVRKSNASTSDKLHDKGKGGDMCSYAELRANGSKLESFCWD